ncbi:MAG: hypothetical protein MI867_18425, partial [Pseudomonadales bacterium]|nr:hypothetical protein [Pseudomonadales bacterium]
MQWSMKKGNLGKRLCLLVVVLAAAPLHAQVLELAAPRGIEARGTMERAGSVQTMVFGDMFADASPENPVYLRYTLPSDIVLSETLVPPGGGPIYLAMVLQIQDGNLRAAPDTVAIARWVAGENQFWIRISQPSSSWVDPELVQQSVVSWAFGLEIPESHNMTFGAYQNGWANLPFN